MSYDSLDLAVSQVPVIQPNKKSEQTNPQVQQAPSFSGAGQDTFVSSGISAPKPQMVEAPAQEAPQEVGYVPEEPKKGLINLKTIAAGLLLATGAVATHKTVGLSKALNAAKESGAVSKETEFKTAKTFFQNANPLNWTSNKEAIQKLADGGYTAVEGTGERIFKNGDDVLILNGKKALTNSFEAHEAGAKLIDEVKVAPEGKETPEAETPEGQAEQAKAPETTTDSATSAPKATSTPKLALSDREKFVLTQYSQVKSRKAVVERLIKDVAPGSDGEKALNKELKQLDKYLQHDEIKAVVTKVKEHRAAINAQAPAQTNIQKLNEISKIKKQMATLNPSSKKYQNLQAQLDALGEKSTVAAMDTKALTNAETIAKNKEAARAEIQKRFFGGNKIEKATGFFSTSANNKNIKRLTNEMEKAGQQYEALSDKKSAQALALQDRMDAIQEVIQILSAK